LAHNAGKDFPAEGFLQNGRGFFQSRVTEENVVAVASNAEHLHLGPLAHQVEYAQPAAASSNSVDRAVIA